MYLGTLLESLVELLLIIVLGYFIRKNGLVTEESVKELSTVLLSVILPLSVLSSGGEKGAQGAGRNIALCFLIVSLYYIAAFVISFPYFRFFMKDKAKTVLSVNMSVFANTSFVGIPLARVMFGSEGVIYAVIYNLIYNVFMFTVGVSLFEGGKKNAGKMLKNIFLDPLSLSSIAAVILFLLPYKLPSFIQNFLTLTGDISTPLSMMIVGAWLVGVDAKAVFRRKESYLVSLMRLIILPVLVLLALLPFHIEETLRGTVVLLSAVPVGALNVILAEKYGCDRFFVNEAMMLSLCLSALTIPLVMVLL